MRHRPILLAAGAAASLAFMGGCSSVNAPEAHPAVFLRVPWTGVESLKYELVESRGATSGTCTLETHPDFEAGRTKLSQLCDDGGPHRDDRQAIVDAKTLAPIFTVRTITNETKATTTTFEASYGGDSAQLKADTDGRNSNTTRTKPTANAKVPEPAWYDDESLFWVMRGITLTSGFKASYTNLNPGNGRVFNVDIEVQSQESVKVPAGEFQAWKIKVKTESITQFFWVEVAAPNRVIKARIERIVYELLAAP